MTSATSRALDLLELLQSAGLRTVEELAGRLEVDPRTVRRHVERLREIGIPVEAVRGRHGGYRIAPGFRMPPLMLTQEEAVALLTGLVAARAERGDAAIATAIAKIERSLPASVVDSVRGLLEVAVFDTREDGAPVDPAVLLTAADAIRDRRPLAMTYRSGDEVTRRTVQPHDLVAYNGRWYLSALDSLSGEVRTFRVDRIRGLRALRGTFPAPPPKDARAALIDGFARADYRHTVRLRIRATAEEIARHLPPSVAVLEEADAPDGDERTWQRATIRAQSLDWLPAVLLALDRQVLIDDPLELRHLVVAAATRLVEMSGVSEAG